MDAAIVVIEGGVPPEKGASPSGTALIHNRLYNSGRRFTFPFRGLSLAFSASQYNRVLIARIPYWARVIEFAYRFDVQDTGLWLFPVLSNLVCALPAVTQVANGSMGDLVSLMPGGGDPSSGTCALESEDSLRYTRVPLGFVLPAQRTTLGLYVVNDASDSVTHYLTGWFQVDELVQHGV